ncbi:hypothetical protein MUK42_10735 [Musa troglodytarum]|uniref:Uncharacterized protein n=1 Tax=Musa troglodytarum TaxID=320322 RepID=A0A9E7GJJ6_9LILI|nr:hypothetical protein MUK42_10735 [Musa troglodytarum]
MPRTERAGPPVIVEIALLAIRSKTTTLACSSLRSSCRVIWFGDRASIQSPPPVSLQVDLRPDLVAIVLREGRSSNGTIRGESVSVRRRLRSRLMEVEPPGPLRYLIGAAVMMVGVVLPLGYMMFRIKRVPSSSSTYSKQTLQLMIPALECRTKGLI